MNTINSISLIVIISMVIVGITIFAALYLVKQKKLKGLTAFELFVGFWLMIAAIVWLATVLQLYGLKESKNVWDIASMVFTFLGTILTAGTAIAGITALLSYISINDKLKKAEEGLNLAQEKVTKFEELYEKTEQDLNSAQEKVTEFKELYEKTEQDLNSAQKTLTEFQGLYEKTEQDLNSAQKTLTEFQELHQRSMELKQQIEDMEKYQVLIQDLDNTKIDDTETNQAAESAAAQILKSNYSQFEHRLKARAILDSITARKQFDKIRQNPSADAWQQNITVRGEIMALWQLVYQGSNHSNLEINQENYASAVFNYGASYTFAARFHNNDEDKKVYLDLLHQASKQYALTLQIDPNSYQAATNWGNALSNEAEALPNTELAEKRRLWQLAGEKYDLALRIKSNVYEAENNWGAALNREAEALPNTELAEKRRLWQEAGKKYDSALQIQPDYCYSTVENWRITLSNEANTLPDTEWEEKFNLWQSALNKVQTLQNLSEKHQQSSAIQNLVNQIEQQIADLEKHKPLS